jgi:copper chaperone CopZ
MGIQVIIDSLYDCVESFGYKVVFEPTSPIEVGQVAMFFTRADIEDSANPNWYKFTAHFELVFIEKTYSNCVSKINAVLQNISPDILGGDVIVSVEGIETREKEEGEPYYAMALLLSITYFGNEL